MLNFRMNLLTILHDLEVAIEICSPTSSVALSRYCQRFADTVKDFDNVEWFMESAEKLSEIAGISESVLTEVLEELSQGGFITYDQHDALVLFRLHDSLSLPSYRSQTPAEWQAIIEPELPLEKYIETDPKILKLVEQLQFQWRKNWAPKGHSKHIADIKRRKIQGIGHCEVCCRKDKFILHHKHYKTWGKERSKDCALLCPRCHSRVHKEISKRWNQIKKARHTYYKDNPPNSM